MPRRDPDFLHVVTRGLEAALATLSQPSDGNGKGRSSSRRGKGGGVRSAAGGAALLGGASSLAASLALRWARSRRPSLPRLARGAAAGIAAAGAIHALRIFLRRREVDDPGTPAPELGDELLAGAGRGVLYAALLAPYLPGPPILRGAIAGTADYFAAPLGGLFARLQPLSPVRRVPVISILLETGDAEDDPYLTFLLHGALLGILYGRPTAED